MILLYKLLGGGGVRFGLCKLLRSLFSMSTEEHKPTSSNQSSRLPESLNSKIPKKLKFKNEGSSLVLVACLELTFPHLVNMNLDPSPSPLPQIEAKQHFHITSPSEQQIGRRHLFQRMQKVTMSLSRTFLLLSLPH